MQSTSPSLSVFFPAYNDAGSIATLVERALARLPQLTDDYEVIVVNDGSHDATARVLGELQQCHPQLRVVHHPVNRGYGGALRSGFAAATKDWIFYTDGDGQYDVGELPHLWALKADGVDVVNGYKRKRSDELRRVWLGNIYRWLACGLYGLPVRDVDCDFRLMRRAAVQSLRLTSTSGVICTELVYRLHRSGCRFVETPVHHYPRLHGQSQFFTLRRVSQTARDFFTLWWRLIVWERVQRAFSLKRAASALPSTDG